MRFIKKIRISSEKNDFENFFANWTDEINEVAEKYNNRTHSPIELTDIEATLKQNTKWGFFLHVFIRQKKAIKSKYKSRHLVRTTD